jgi:inosine-uridine nucleoside N-ribohydrolase
MKRLSPGAGLIATLLSAGILFSGLVACGNGQHAARSVQPVVIDTDMSSDDIMALTYLLKRPDISVHAITVEGTGVANGQQGAENASRLMRALNIYRHIPIAYGPAQPMSGSASFPQPWRRTADRMYGLKLAPSSVPEPPQPPEAAVSLLADTLRRSPRPVTLVTLGPLTNVALALVRSPRIAAKVARIYMMAGAINVPGNEPAHRRAEWNVYIDPRAAGIVLRSRIPVTMIPLDASNNVPITTFFAKAVHANRTTKAMRLLSALLNDPYYAQAPVYFWDPLTAVAAIDSHILVLRRVRLGINEAPGAGLGETAVDRAGTPVSLATTANADQFVRDFLSTLNDGRPIAMPPVPRTQRLSVIFDGTGYSYRVSPQAEAGELAVRLSNHELSRSGGFHLVIGRLSAGKTFYDVSQVIQRGHVTSAPSWFQVTSVLPAPPGADAVWGISLLPGRYVLVSASDGTSALRALTQLRIH